ncbi:MAG: SH3 domain-containing protein [Candidatus Latescibacteria bacterium]|nr:SH3 domain-containing protein [Candidatus Latescibacterota bacterium]
MSNIGRVIVNSVLVLFLLKAGVFAELYKRAPDVLPGTLPEMRTTSYWIGKMKNPDEIILSHDEIEQMNVAYETRIHSPNPFADIADERKPDFSYWWPGHVLMVPDFHRMDRAAIADTVRGRIDIQREFLRSQPWGNALAVEYAGWELDEFENEMALDTVGDEVRVRDGIAVCNTRLRNIPSFFPNEMAVRENAKTRWEAWNVCILKMCRPVTVLHVSRSGEYLLVACDDGYGWVRSEDIAFGTGDEIEEFANPKKFIVCTGDRIQFYSDPKCVYASGWMRMGDRLPVVLGGQIRVPVRNIDGSLTSAKAYVREDENVHNGWLPYTRRNIVETAFKLLDNPYDWTGAWFGRQHENTYRDIFAVFGFRLPWHGALFTIYGHNETVLDPKVGKEEQFRTILKNEPFVTLQSCGGHAQLFLGDYNGMPIVLDQHGYGYEDAEGNYVEVRRCCIGTVEMPTYFLTRKVTFGGLK